MTPLRFEAEHAADWHELDQALARAERSSRRRRGDAPGFDAARLAALYRASCEHLALARARSYPVAMVDRLEALTQRAHQVIYRRHESSLARVGQLFLIDFPTRVRAYRWHVLVATLVFALPMLAVGLLSYFDPGFILSIHDASQVDRFEAMYADGATRLGQPRGADTDWSMFGYYIMNNVGIAFQCFASGLFAGVGSLFYLALNGLYAGSVAGYLSWRGHGTNFFSFVVTHGAFELTAIVLSGAAGLALGHALLAPGRRTRLQALLHAARDAVVIVYGVAAMLVVAAVLEAFWSSSRWVEPSVKFAVGALCWAGVLAYLGWQGRPRR